MDDNELFFTCSWDDENETENWRDEFNPQFIDSSNNLVCYSTLESTGLFDTFQCPSNEHNKQTSIEYQSGGNKEISEFSSFKEMPINRMALNDHKAGMIGLDKERINKIIYETSKGSLFFENEKKKEARVKERVTKLKKQLEVITERQKTDVMYDINKEVTKLENSRDLSRTIVHIDMDAFYAAVEMRDDPSLRDKPMAVGGIGMLSTSNYVARRYGVRAGMPGFIGKKLCPNLVIVRQHFDKYRAVSNEVKAILAEYDPNFSMLSLDEAYLDITEYLKTADIDTGALGSKLCFNCTKIKCICDDSELCNTDEECDHTSKIQTFLSSLSLAELVVLELRYKIYLRTQLTASAGIASNNMLAKICSDRNKPDGQFFLSPSREHILEFVRNLPIRKVYGIGRVCEQVLNSLGIKSCQDLYESRAILKILFSEIAYNNFLHISLGISSNHVGNEDERKSISTETTFGGLSKTEDLLKMCMDLCNSLAVDIASEGIQGKTVTVKFKLVSFEIRSRSRTLPSPISSFDDLHRIARDIVLHEISNSRPKPLHLRLMGVRLSELSNANDKGQNKIHMFLKKTSDYERSENMKAVSYEVSDLSEPQSDSQVNAKPNDVITGVIGISIDASSVTDLNEGSTSNSTLQYIQCPVCNQHITTRVDINEHIDSCLNRTAIREIVQTENALSTTKRLRTGTKRKRSSDSKKSQVSQTLFSYFSK